MLVYLLKSSACLAIFLMFYQLLLEKERMHVFKRYYLLVSMIVALIIPALVFVEYVEVAPITSVVTTIPGELSTTEMLQMETSTEYLPLILWAIYLLGAGIFGLQFLRNLTGIFKRIHNNPKNKRRNIIQVLLHNPVIPHTFFKYVFLNRQQLEAKQIPEAVLLHEEAHATQKHSLDVLFVELLQLLFWFNPLLYVAKKAIKLNHEFLADQAVVTAGMPANTYQSMLLAFSSKAGTPLPIGFGMANSINYSSIKKRISVMKKSTTKKSVVLRSLLLLPLLALLLFGFSETKEIPIHHNSPLYDADIDANRNASIKEELQNINVLKLNMVDSLVITEDIEILIDKNGLISVNDQHVALENLPEVLNKFNDALTKDQRSNMVHSSILPDVDVPMGIIRTVEKMVQDYGVTKVELVRPSKSKAQSEASKSQVAKFNRIAEKYNAVPIQKRVIPLQELKQLESIYKLMTIDQKRNAQPFPECPPPPGQEPATEKQVAEYNAMAKEYNAMIKSGNIRIIKSEVDHLKSIYARMTDAQREKAEPFPDFPPPPPAPEAPRAVSPVIGHMPPPPPPHPSEIEVSPVVDAIPEVIHIEEINPHVPPVAPPPPPPVSPLDHIIEMAKQGATFYYKDQEISSDKAIAILKNNDQINIETTGSHTKHPIVKLSTEPFEN